MDLIGADAHLGPESVAHPIGHASGGVPIYACGVDGGHEFFGQGGGGGEDAVGVVRAVGVDVGYCSGKGWDGLYGEDWGEELGCVVGVLGVLEEMCGLE